MGTRFVYVYRLQVHDFKILYQVHRSTHAFHIDMYGAMHFTLFGRNAFHFLLRVQSI